MFSSKPKRMLPIQSLVGAGMVMQGDIRFEGGLRIDGEVHGNITALEDKALLVISETGKVHGAISVAHLLVSGQVRGPIVASTLLELHPSATVFGNVKYKALEMHPGAVVDGVLQHDAECELPTASTPLTLPTNPEKNQRFNDVLTNEAVNE